MIPAFIPPKLLPHTLLTENPAALRHCGMAIHFNFHNSLINHIIHSWETHAAGHAAAMPQVPGAARLSPGANDCGMVAVCPAEPRLAS
jgi:hypothetical protein